MIGIGGLGKAIFLGFPSSVLWMMQRVVARYFVNINFEGEEMFTNNFTLVYGIFLYLLYLGRQQHIFIRPHVSWKSIIDWEKYTLPETKSKRHWKSMVGVQETSFWGPAYFQGRAVCFRECTQPKQILLSNDSKWLQLAAICRFRDTQPRVVMQDNPGPSWNARLRPGSAASPSAFGTATFSLLPIELSLLLVMHTWYDLSGKNRLTFNLAVTWVITITWGQIYVSNWSYWRRFECLRRAWNYPLTPAQASCLREARKLSSRYMGRDAIELPKRGFLRMCLWSHSSATSCY